MGDRWSRMAATSLDLRASLKARRLPIASLPIRKLCSGEMKMNLRQLRLPVALSAVVLLNVGCVERRVVVRERVPAYAPSETVVVTEAPPAPQTEVIPVAPGPDYVWVGGYWRREGPRWVWTPGRYTLRPRPAAVWVPGHWVAHRRGWAWVPGHWR